MVGAGRWVRLGTSGANEFAHICCWECHGCHTSNAVEPIPRPIRIELPSQYGLNGDLESQFRSPRRRMMNFGPRGPSYPEIATSATLYFADAEALMPSISHSIRKDQQYAFLLLLVPASSILDSV